VNTVCDEVYLTAAIDFDHPPTQQHQLDKSDLLKTIGFTPGLPRLRIQLRELGKCDRDVGKTTWARIDLLRRKTFRESCGSSEARAFEGA